MTTIEASRAEQQRAMPGDGLVPKPMFTVTHAITIGAPPECVWPWLLQMGSSRGGWYSYDRIDNGGRPSANRILNEYQQRRQETYFPACPSERCFRRRGHQAAMRPDPHRAGDARPDHQLGTSSRTSGIGVFAVARSRASRTWLEADGARGTHSWPATSVHRVRLPALREASG